MNKSDYIAFFRSAGFTCFPIPAYNPDNRTQNHKAADARYKAADTDPDQVISPHDNYGLKPTGGNCIIDLDSKEHFREFAQSMISGGYMVIETPHGWHIPVVGLGSESSKVELFDYDYQPDKKIIEIQGPKQYVIGPGCEILAQPENVMMAYHNVGTETIWDAKGNNFHHLIDTVCKTCNVTGRKGSRSIHKHMRDQFLKNKPPTKGQSNDYFFQAALQCNTDGIPIHEAESTIKKIYQEWAESKYYSDRTWDSIQKKIDDVYGNDYKIKTGRPAKKQDTMGTIAKNILESRKIYSDVTTDDLYENSNGFLEKINKTLHKEIQHLYPDLIRQDFLDLLFKLVGLAPDLPETSKAHIAFDDCIVNIETLEITTHAESPDLIADMGFKGYNYDACPPSPDQFINVMYGNTPESEHPRINRALKATLTNYIDPRITVIHGLSGVGKSTGLTILDRILNRGETEYSLSVELDQILNDPFIKAKIKDKRLVIFQELPQSYKDFGILKSLTGEQSKNERGFHQDMAHFENKIKIWASGNYLAKIPEIEKDSMYKRRLSLVHNVRQTPYPEDPKLVDRIVEEEGQSIISWIINLPDSDSAYEQPATVRREWENLSSPEIEYLRQHWQISPVGEPDKVSVMTLKREFESMYQTHIGIDPFIKACKEEGFSIMNNVIRNIERAPELKNTSSKNSTL